MSIGKKLQVEGSRSVGSLATTLAMLAAVVAGCQASGNSLGSGGKSASTSGAPTSGGASTAGDADAGTSAPPPPAWDGSAPKGSVAVSGGTMLLTTDHATLVAADPDRDQVSIVDVATKFVRATLPMPPGSEPGRVVEDGLGRVHVALRRGGGVATINLATGSVVSLRQTCAAPRGLAVRTSDNALGIACMGGDLMIMSGDPSVSAPLFRAHVADDLRDIVADGTGWKVSTFRSAQVLSVAPDGSVLDQIKLPGRTDGGSHSFAPQQAFRMVRGAKGGLVVVHHASSTNAVDVSTGFGGPGFMPGTPGTPSPYGGTDGGTPDTCNPSIIIGSVSTVDGSGAPATGPVIPNAVLPVDLAPSADGGSYLVAIAGNLQTGPRAVTAANVMRVSSASSGNDMCGHSTQIAGTNVPGQATAVVDDGAGGMMVQTREPAAVWLIPASGAMQQIGLSAVSVANEGDQVFHANTGNGIACASCHAEARDDGHTWLFTNGTDASGKPNQLPRRTQTFRAGFLDTAPFHWGGDLASMDAVMSEVFVRRMGGKSPTASEQAALTAWMSAVPAAVHDAPDATKAAAIARGKALFADASVGCASCHSGIRFTNNLTVDVGTGGAFQTPSLIDVAFRYPLMHDGSVNSIKSKLLDRSGTHGHTEALSDGQIDDLTAYVESL